MIGVQKYWKVAALAIALAIFPLAGQVHAHDGGGKAGLGVEVNIGANGGALVRGAEVTAVSDSEIKAETSLGQSVISWIVKTDSETDYSAHKGGAEGRENIAVGDTISFRGVIDQSVSGLTVKAKQVKDWSSVETKAALTGVVTSINTTLGSFTVKKGDATTTVQTSSSTKFSEDLPRGKAGGDGASFADIVLSAKVKLAGFFNASTTIFTANSVEIDKDGSWDKEDKKEWREWIKSKVWLKLWNH